MLTLKPAPEDCIGVPIVPILPVSEAKLTDPDVSVKLPVLVIEPEPLADTLITPRLAVETSALNTMLELLVSVDSKIIPFPLKDRVLAIVSVLPEVTETMPEEPLIVPRLTTPEVLIVRFLVPKVIV